MARAGLCSRREAETWIQDGRVTINGRPATLGDRADLASDHVKVDGKLLRGVEAPRYVLLYKPREVMTTCSDPEERTTVLELVRPTFRERLFPVGRLDYQSEGLLLLTNDGELAARVTHPRHGIVREYLAKVRGDLTTAELAKVRRGTTIEGQRVQPLEVERVQTTRQAGNSWWRVTVTEGRTHEVRELFFRVGHPVQKLRRVAIGPIRDDDLQPGDFRELTPTEVRQLEKATRRTPDAASAASPSSRKPRGASRPDRRGGGS
jgi:23S rRNA pseudouridine2605 synthase